MRNRLKQQQQPQARARQAAESDPSGKHVSPSQASPQQQEDELLEGLREQLRERESLTIDEKADVVAKTAQFNGQGAWTLDTSRSIAQGTCTRYLCYVPLTATAQGSSSLSQGETYHSLRRS